MPSSSYGDLTAGASVLGPEVWAVEAAATVTNKVANGTTATLTVSATHNIPVGATIVVTGVDATFNGTYVVTAVAATTISYAKAATVGSAASGGTIKAAFKFTTNQVKTFAAMGYGTATELDLVKLAESAGVSAFVSRADHVHAHDVKENYTGADLTAFGDQHHNKNHADTDHTGASRHDVSLAGTLVGTRTKLNLLAGEAVTLTGADDAGGGKVDVTIHTLPEIISMNLTPPTTAAHPAAVTEWPGGNAFRRCKADLTRAVQFRIVVRVATTFGPAGKLAVQYSTDESVWFFMTGTTNGGTPIAAEFADAATANTTRVGAWTALATAAKADVFLRIVSLDGDAVTSGTGAGTVQLQVR